MNNKARIDLGHVQRTLLIPLFGRAIEYEKDHSLVKDKYAHEIVQKLEVDFGTAFKQLPMPIIINSAIRAYHLDSALEKLIGENPDATIINIGAGLDTTFQRVDNGRIFWYDLDLPDSIALRKTLIPEGERNRFIGKSVFDRSWFNDIQERHSKVFFMAGGVLVYLEEKEIKRLFLDIIEEFPGSEITFEIYSKKFLWLRNHFLDNRKRGQTSRLLVRMVWGVNSGKAIAKWSNRITIIDEFPFYSRINLEEYWDKKYLSSLRVLNFFRSIKMLHLRLG